MRVLVLTVVHTPLDARIHHRQIAALRQHGHHVTEAAPWSDYEVTPPDDLATIDLPRASGRDRLEALRAARRLLKDVAKTYDLVLLHDPELLLVLPGLDLDAAVVWDVHEDTAGAVVDKPWLPDPLRPAARTLARILESAAERGLHLILAEDAYRDRFGKDHPVVPNTPWVPEDDPPPPGDDRVVYLGRLSRLRGAHDLVAAGRRLAPDVTMDLMGPADDDIRPLLEQADAAGEVRWHGFVPNDQALDRVEGALAGLSLLHDEPNYRSSLPTKVVEYMARGVPVITTPLPAAVRLVEEHDAGVVVDFEDPRAVAEAVEELRADAGRREQLGRNGREAARKHYDWHRDGDAFVSQLEAWAHG